MSEFLPVFADDAPLDAKREAAQARLMAMCPAPMQLLVAPMVRVAVERASDAEIDALMVDVERLPDLAANGDSAGIIELARRYGANDDMVSMYLPLFEQFKSA